MAIGQLGQPELGAEDVDWDRQFGLDGVRWLHTGGIVAALGEHTPTSPRRPWPARVATAPWSPRRRLPPGPLDAFGGQAQARRVNRHLVEHVDVLLGNEEDFTAALGFDVPGLDGNHAARDG
jgi:2-dehydro-3-deoxygluconokinase